MGEDWRHKPRTRRVRPIRVDGDVAYVTLTRGLVAVIDAADVPLVKDRNWSALACRGGFYAGRRETTGPYSGKTVHLQRVLMAAGDHEVVIFRDHDPLNCRRSNLRWGDQTINNQSAAIRRDNASGYRGVFYAPGKRRTKPWKAQINHQGKSYRLGGFATADDAARAYNDKALELYGGSANLNILEG